ncbi:MAG: hypothetical protein OEZ13_13585 [Spirochaetia bacterium]|nr:hypothetical protein [Spirochaetia bacterium]
MKYKTFIILFFCSYNFLFSSEENTQKNENLKFIEIELNSGKFFRGKFLEETDGYIQILTHDELEIKILKKNISQSKLVEKISAEEDYHRDLIGLAVRFFGKQIAVDAGFIFIGEMLKQGFPAPWVSFIYNF